MTSFKECFEKDNFFSTDCTPISVCLIALVVGVFLLIISCRRKRRESAKAAADLAFSNLDPEQQRMRPGRKLSFTSAGMGMGSFPEKSNMPEPTINACIYFENCPSEEKLLPLVRTIFGFNRFAGIPKGTVGKNDWRIHPCAELHEMNHVRTVKVSSDEELHSLVEKGCGDSCRWDSQPWWQFVRYENSGGNDAIIVRIDHVLGDGIALVTMFSQVLTFADGSKIESLLPPGLEDKFKRKLTLWNKIYMFFQAIGCFFHALALPASRFDTDITFSKGYQQDMVYSGTRVIRKFHTLPLSFIKDLKAATGVTINDVLFACLGGTIRKYCEDHADPLIKKKNIQCRALMPISLPRPKRDAEDPAKVLRNKFVFVSVDIGVKHDTKKKRLKAANKQMNVIKTSPLAFVQHWVQSTFPPLLPVSLARQTVHDLFCRHSLVFSNVPGPTEAVACGGEVVVGMQMFFNNLIPQVGILSYNGQVFMNMNLDPEMVPDSEVLPDLFLKELLSISDEYGVKVPQHILDMSK